MNARFTRRSFLGSSLAVGGLVPPLLGATEDEDRKVLEHRLDEIAVTPVLRVDAIDKAAKIASMELLRNGRNFVVRVRTTDGAEGIGVPNAMHLIYTYPIFVNRVAPFFVGKDARQLEPLLWELYRNNDNYKYQGLALWVCVAAAEFAILDLLGKLTNRSIGDLLGGVKRRDIAVYRASGVRGNTPEDEVANLKQLVAETGARGAEVSSRRPDEQERRLVARPHREAHPTSSGILRQGDDPLRRLEQLLRRAQSNRDRTADGGVRLRLL